MSSRRPTPAGLWTAGVLLWAITGGSAAAADPPGAACLGIENQARRLACFDEAIGKVCQLLSSGVHGDRTVVVHSPSADLVEDLDDKLAQRKLAMLCRVGGKDGDWRVLGRLARPLVETLDLLRERGSATTKELAEQLGIPANACHNRIRRLVLLHLIREEKIAAAAPNAQYRFHAIHV